MLLIACDKEVQIKAMIWNGGNHEITRNLENDQVEFLPTDDPKFLDFRCVVKEDMEEIIKEALKECGKATVHLIPAPSYIGR